ncbi:MAG TPA: alpha-amylase family glycosyl hydrolase [Actinocrinis sp.]|jgi:glycogen operon protein
MSVLDDEARPVQAAEEQTCADPDTGRYIGGLPVAPGRGHPFGATVVDGGVDFCVYSGRAAAVTLVLYRRGEPEPFAELPFPEDFRSGGVFAMTVLGLDVEDLEYGYRAAGPAWPEPCDRFDERLVLSDPYARALSGGECWGERPAAVGSPARPTAGYRHRAFVPPEDFDWEDDRPPRIPDTDLVIYEAHVRGFTQHPSAGVHHPGTFAGMVQKLPYLQELGINCIELMPVFEYDECGNPRRDPATGARLHDYWGYNTVGFFAPKAALAATGRLGMQSDEFRNLVKQAHRAGIAVILDVVFSHTAEGGEQGPTISFRGLDNAAYYMLGADGSHLNHSGFGNTLNCNDPMVRGFVLDCLRHWAAHYHVDGFRLDLAGVLGRGPNGHPPADPPLLETIARDPVLRDCKLIAGFWGAAGLYPPGGLPDYCRWSEWNGRYRDTARRFLRGDEGAARDMATRFVGSPDLYGERGTAASVNFVTSHDGFTLHDLVSYEHKRNEANGEHGLDGESRNLSWNCGAEGPSDDPQVVALRRRQMRNALLVLFTAHGVPMLTAGDEVGRTQRGNNNAYCQDGELSWFDWSLLDQEADLLRFVRRAVAFRRAHPALRRPVHTTGQANGTRGDLFPDVSWHGTVPWRPDWSHHNRLLAVMLYDRTAKGGHDCVYVAMNSYWERLELKLPALPHPLSWHLFADTAAKPPHDAYEPGEEPPLPDRARLTVGPRSTVVLTARRF